MGLSITARSRARGQRTLHRGFRHPQPAPENSRILLCALCVRFARTHRRVRLEVCCIIYIMLSLDSPIELVLRLYYQFKDFYFIVILKFRKSDTANCVEMPD